jgi:hypothetical protein
VPAWHERGCGGGRSGFEDWGCVVAEAGRWLRNLPHDVRVTNMHTLNAKTKITRGEGRGG